MITTHILTYNNENTLEKTLNSISFLKNKIIIGDLGSTDNTINIAKKYGAEIILVKETDNFSKIRNEIVKNSKTEWQFYIEPWEELISEFEIPSNNNYFSIIEEEILSKQIRLWNKNQLFFTNPIFENINSKNAEFSDNIIICHKKITNYDNYFKIIDKWKKTNPTLADPYYYEACLLLSQRKYQDFLKSAEYYLFYEQEGMSVVMTRYYCAMVQCYIIKEIKKSIKNIIFCLSRNIAMSEFWCLLGDVFYYLSEDFEKAASFYENALILGSRRLKNDIYPMHIPKYKEYPEKMIKSCQELLNKSTLYSQFPIDKINK